MQWLTDNGSTYTAHDTHNFAKELNLEACTTAVSSQHSNGMAEKLVKTMKEDYIAFMPKPDVRTALQRCSIITMKTILTVRWDIDLRGNTSVSGHR
ncbi:transposase [Trabulsiella guamensis ATCC 49490]|uniref:Transposase n=1 Tax=Trabulsiella guamensis ATCC 49490 TaxID=1005994 RepID=A0A085A820_9ENTR|nr:transposase [Trabulsiella guamensis ATCC 49490]